MKDFKDKVAVITGAGSGIGRYLAVLLAKYGAHVAICDINEKTLNETSEMLRKYNVSVSNHLLDVSDSEAIEALPKKVIEAHGKVNLVFNNAGVALSAQLDEVKREDFDWLFNINFWGVVNGTEAFLPYLKESKDGHIINISSVFGMISLPTQGSYNASKFAVRGYTEALRQEMIMGNQPVGVSCVHPGGIATEIARNARVSESDDKEELAASFDKLARTTPKKAAQTILKGVMKNKARVMIGADAHFIHFMVRLLGSGYQFLTTAFTQKINPNNG